MGKSGKLKKSVYVRWALLRALLILYDVIAVNASFYLALLTRFYVAKQFHAVAGQYIRAFMRYVPFYTIFCLIVYAVFRLYSGILKYAGFNDLRRILLANGVCLIGHVVGTLLFVQRMPISFYCIGTVIQLVLTVISRFAYRLLIVERSHYAENHQKESLNTMIVGAGAIGKMVVREMRQESAAKPVCVLNPQSSNFGYLLDGVPVLNGADRLNEGLEKYKIRIVILASPGMPEQMRETLRQQCADAGVTVRDYTGFFQNVRGGITLRDLAGCCTGRVEVIVGGSSRSFEDCEQALRSVTGQHTVRAVRAKADVTVIELDDSTVTPNDLNVEWIKTQKKETGEEISFF